MSLTTALYLTDLLYQIGQTTILFCILGGLFFTLITAGYFATYDERDDKYSNHKLFSKILKKVWILFLLIIISVFMPSKETMYLMLGTSYLNQTNIPSKTTEALELKLDDYIKELKKAK